MAKYVRLPTGYYSRRAQYLSAHFFLDFEVQEIVYGSHGAYRTFHRNPSLGASDPSIYLQRMVKARILYVTNLRRQGLDNNQIRQAIIRLYERKGWMSSPTGFIGVGERRDVFKMIRAYRKASIESGDYRRPPRKGAHHTKLTKGDITKQGVKRSHHRKQLPPEPTSGSSMFGR